MRLSSGTLFPLVGITIIFSTMHYCHIVVLELITIALASQAKMTSSVPEANARICSIGVQIIVVPKTIQQSTSSVVMSKM